MLQRECPLRPHLYVAHSPDRACRDPANWSGKVRSARVAKRRTFRYPTNQRDLCEPGELLDNHGWTLQSRLCEKNPIRCIHVFPT
jgi:hypothetical protein